MKLRAAYQRRFDVVLTKLAQNIETQLRDYLDGVPRVDRIGARAKSVDRFLAKSGKAELSIPKYDDPLNQIQDQVGARVIAFYLSDVEVVSEVIERYFRSVEQKNLVPESEWEFGYFGKHYILFTPSDSIDADMPRDEVPRFFELQIKTLFQHAWSEANHDLGYKPGAVPLTADDKRRMALSAAQAWGSDRIFDELIRERSPKA